MAMEDRTGAPRSIDDLKEALEAFEDMMKDPPMDRPLLVLNSMTIRDGLRELIYIRTELAKRRQ